MYFYPLYSGSSGNCSLVESENTHILVDVGVTGKAALYALSSCNVDPNNISAIVVTHEHSDHIKSVGVISRKFNLPIYANNKTWAEMSSKIGEVAQENIRVFETDHEFFIDGIEITPFKIPHDTVDPVAFSFCAEGRRVSIATDIGHVTERIAGELERSNLILLESNHDIDMLHKSTYPASLKRRILGDNGHLSNESCANLLINLYEKGLRRCILGHLSKETNTEQLAFETVSRILSRNGIGDNYMLKIAHRDRVSGKFEV